MAAEIEFSLWTGEADLSTPGQNLLCYVRRMADVRAASQEIVCPHCKKPFSGELLAEGSRHEGFKCPHCRLFVPAERASDDGEAAP
jgi:DNA-directed RNA polymerase subunit RPC12/RpoP